MADFQTGLAGKMIPAHTFAPKAKPSVTDFTISIPGSTARAEDEPAPSRWGTFEFKVYYAVFAVVVPIMIWIPIQLSYGGFGCSDLLLLGRLALLSFLCSDLAEDRKPLKSRTCMRRSRLVHATQ